MLAVTPDLREPMGALRLSGGSCLLLLLLFKTRTEERKHVEKRRIRKKKSDFLLRFRAAAGKKTKFFISATLEKAPAPLPGGRRRPSGGFRIGPNAF